MADRKSYENILVENIDGITTVTLNRPDKRNAMNPALDEEMLESAGRRVPDDTSIVGFDDVELAEHITPGLTTVWVHKRAMGAIGVKTLVARAANPEDLAMTITLPVELIKRQSVAAYPTI